MTVTGERVYTNNCQIYSKKLGDKGEEFYLFQQQKENFRQEK